MKKTQIQLTEYQFKLVKEISDKRKISSAKFIREAVDFYSASLLTGDQNAKAVNALKIIGRYKSNKKDISQNHDDYLEKAINK